MEGTAVIAMTAFQAVRSFLFQLFIMIVSKAVTGFGKIVILIDQTNVQARRTGLAVIAVNTLAACILGAKLPMTE